MNRANMKNVLLCFLLSLALILSSCVSEKEIKPAVSDIAAISSAAGFLAAGVKESGGFIASHEQREKAPNYAYLYDNAVAAIALSFAGAHWQAQKIADAMVFAQEHDRTFKDGRLRNAYLSGDPKSDSGRSIAAGKITVNLPGFWKDGSWQEDSYTVSTSTGNMAWTILALCTVAENAPAEKSEPYLEAAVRAADFVLTLQAPDSGFSAGYEGWDEAQIKLNYKSTEHNISLFCALTSLAEALAESKEGKARAYRKAADHAKAFVSAMYDKELCCFYTGTEADGKTISKGVIPLDSNSLAILAFGKDLADAYQTVSFIEKTMKVGGGFDFSAGDLDGIWNEGSAQMAVCYSALGISDKFTAVMEYLKTQESAAGSIPAADRDGVSTGFFTTGSNTMWEYDNVQSIGATGWLALAQLGRTPFESRLRQSHAATTRTEKE